MGLIVPNGLICFTPILQIISNTFLLLKIKFNEKNRRLFFPKYKQNCWNLVIVLTVCVRVLRIYNWNMMNLCFVKKRIFDKYKKCYIRFVSAILIPTKNCEIEFLKVNVKSAFNYKLKIPAFFSIFGNA